MNTEPLVPNTTGPTRGDDDIPAPDKLMVVMFLLGLTLFGLILLVDLLSGLFR